MTFNIRLQRWITAGLLVSAASLAFAPVASADSSWRRYRGGSRVSYQQWQGRPYGRGVYVHDSGVGPLFAGLIGGFILGSAISHPAPVVVHERVYSRPRPQARYRYEDPYNDVYYDSIDECGGGNGPRPRVIRVVEISSGDCVSTLHWQNGGWCDDNGQRFNGYDDGYNDQDRRVYQRDHQDDGRYNDRNDDRNDDRGDWHN